MGELGIDVSEWQAGMDTERVSRENGLSFAMVRTNYGSSHDDAQFHRHCDGFERAGVIVTPYCYPLATDTRGSIEDAARIIGGRYNRMIVDWEVGSGGGDHLRAAHERAWELGFFTPVVYDPKWYWEQQGSPNVDWMRQSGRVKAHWKSWYPDNIPGDAATVLRKLPDYVWGDNRGGIPTGIVQFSSSVLMSGWGKVVDANWFQGTKAQLVALLTEGDETMLKDDIAKVTHAPPESGAKDGVYEDRADSVLGAALGHAWAARLNTERIAADVAQLKASGVPVNLVLSDADKDDIADRLADRLAQRLKD